MERGGAKDATLHPWRDAEEALQRGNSEGGVFLKRHVAEIVEHDQFAARNVAREGRRVFQRDQPVAPAARGSAS